MLNTNKKKGIAVGVITAVFFIYDLLDNKTWFAFVLESWTSAIPGGLIAYWLYRREEPNDNEG
ncbi:MAG: hypothetical protein CL942_10975 [Desulfovibrio sp.]|nr:hypothetical protein [Desulfovibrio sp.]